MRHSPFWSRALLAAALLAFPALLVAADVSGDWTYAVSESWSKGSAAGARRCR